MKKSFIFLMLAVACLSSCSDSLFGGPDLLCNTRNYLMVKFEGDENYSMLDKNGDVKYRNRFHKPSQIWDDMFWEGGQPYSVDDPDNPLDLKYPVVFIHGLATKIDRRERTICLIDESGKEIKTERFIERYDPLYLYSHTEDCFYVYSHSGKELFHIEGANHYSLVDPSDDGSCGFEFYNYNNEERIIQYYSSSGDPRYKIEFGKGGDSETPSMIDGKVCIRGSLFDKDGNVLLKSHRSKEGKYYVYTPLGDGLYLADIVEGGGTTGPLRWGIIDEKGNEIVPCIYAMYAHNDRRNRASLDFNFMRLGDYFIFLKERDHWVLVDKNGKEKETGGRIVSLSRLNYYGTYYGDTVFGPTEFEVNGD